MKLHRDLGVTQKTAWFMLHRIRETWADTPAEAFADTVEADETFVGVRAYGSSLAWIHRCGEVCGVAASTRKAS